ncbi:TIGR02757 family protein [Myroides sp. LJL115]
MTKLELKDFLDQKAELFNTPDFIQDDPIGIAHGFSLKEDIEIAGFLSATIAWGNRKMIIKNAQRIMDIMGNSPYDFIMSHTKGNLEAIPDFVHRTFNKEDLKTFFRALQHIYTTKGGLEGVFSQHPDDLQLSISEFKKIFFEIEHLPRTQKHISDPMKNSAAKRINMFLRWMVRTDNNGVDFGLWQSISPANLSCPLDVHSGNVARKLGLLHRKVNDAKALSELDTALRELDPLDPVRYDFALFGLGAIEKF